MEFLSLDFNAFLEESGTIALVIHDNKERQTLDEKLGGQIEKFLSSKSDQDQPKIKDWKCFQAPASMKADEIWVVEADDDMRRKGGELANLSSSDITIHGADLEFAFGFALRNYRFDKYKADPKSPVNARFIVKDSAQFTTQFAHFQALTEGVHLARDLVNEPANILTTQEFANRISTLQELGVEVEILDEEKLSEIGLNALLGVGQGSESPSKVAIMRWEQSKSKPIALVGKGVVFDTGGISIKPAAGMEDMIMDMGGAATVVGTMHALASRKAKANVIGIVGLVENMPDGKAQRPGDIVKTYKGTTVEVLNTDAEGRLVLADILWYVQERFAPSAIIDLATLTGAVIVALGPFKTGVFGNDDAFTQNLLAAAQKEEEGAWHMPLGDEYSKLLKSKHADLGNIGGREAGSITAAEFLQHFIQEGTPWIHLDIAGTATVKSSNHRNLSGATGWGVLTLNRLITDHFED